MRGSGPRAPLTTPFSTTFPTSNTFIYHSRKYIPEDPSRLSVGSLRGSGPRAPLTTPFSTTFPTSNTFIYHSRKYIPEDPSPLSVGSLRGSGPRAPVTTPFSTTSPTSMLPTPLSTHSRGYTPEDPSPLSVGSLRGSGLQSSTHHSILYHFSYIYVTNTFIYALQKIVLDLKLLLGTSLGGSALSWTNT